MNNDWLTDEQRDELLALLEDDDRMTSEYPKVAEYFESAPRLAGTGNTREDAAFDLRLLYYMTSQINQEINAYWEIVSPLVNNRSGKPVIDGGAPNGSPRLSFAQMILQEVFAYAVPSPKTIQWIRANTGNKTILELGAGRGYWAKEIRNVGLNIEAYDIEPPNFSGNTSFPQSGKQVDVWHEVKATDNDADMFKNSPDSVLFLCWPPGWENRMAVQSLKSFESKGGTKLIYIGEPKGGKTANNEFFSALSARWKLVSVDRNFVTWWNLEDQAQIWVRQA